MNLAWGDFWQKSRKWLKTGWLITAALVAVYIGAVEPMNRYREIAAQKTTGLGAVAFEPISLWQAPAYDKYIARARGVVGGLPGAFANQAPKHIAVAALAVGTDQAAPPPPSTSPDDRKLVRNSAMDLIVKNPADAAEKMRQLAEGAGGFLVSSQVRGAESAATAEVTVRVPVGRFEEVRAAVRQLGMRVESDRIEVQDVTKDYVDREARLRNLRAQEQQYLAILKRAASVKDTLEVSEQLNEVRGSIEEQQAEFDALSKQVETVGITVSLRAEADARVFGLEWRPLYRLKMAAREGLNGLGDYVAAMTSLVFYLPTILLWLATILIGAALGWRILRRAPRVFFAFPKTVVAEKETS